MHSFHVMFQILPLNVSIVTKVAFELARRRFSCDVMGPFLVLMQSITCSVSLLTLTTLELMLVFCLWMVFLVVGVQLFHAVVVTLADLTDESEKPSVNT